MFQGDDVDERRYREDTHRTYRPLRCLVKVGLPAEEPARRLSSRCRSWTTAAEPAAGVGARIGGGPALGLPFGHAPLPPERRSRLGVRLEAAGVIDRRGGPRLRRLSGAGPRKSPTRKRGAPVKRHADAGSGACVAPGGSAPRYVPPQSRTKPTYPHHGRGSITSWHLGRKRAHADCGPAAGFADYSSRSPREGEGGPLGVAMLLAHEACPAARLPDARSPRAGRW